MEKGQIHVQTENIFPIIKKFLYSDHEIFLRELISNAVDATEKLHKLTSMGEVKGEVGDTHIEVKIDKEAKTLHVIDRGIGMTQQEVEKYINQIAFSSAEEFLKKFKKADEAANIIGHFGLGFYSSFMVADKVEIVSKSYKKSSAIHWSCDGSPEYTMEKADKKERGTEIILHINEESIEFLEESRIDELLNKYCKFLPVPIQFGETERKEKNEADEEISIVEPKIVNNTSPAWTRSPKELKDEDYKSFYRELYPLSEPPLFWIHLNVDYPFNLTGILYFPKVGNRFEVQKNKIQLYCNQVFVTDNVEEIVPEYLMLLQGVIDSPDIPLNVSRSYLQSDPNVKKINSHISKKVADKLHEIFKDAREDYEQKWESVGIFVKYGMITDDKFYDRANDICLLESTDGKFHTIEEYKELIKANQENKDGKLVVLYTTDAESQHGYIDAAVNRGYNVLRLDTVIDSHFLSHMEQKLENVTFKRVDADTVDNLVEKEESIESVLSDEEQEKIKTLFSETLGNEQMAVVTKALNPDDAPVTITKPEFMRRMSDMAKISGDQWMGGMPEQFNLVINTNHPLAGKILRSKGKKEQYVKQLYDIALLSQNMLKGVELTEFVKRSFDVLED